MTGKKAEHELSITRLMDVPVEAVWRAWTERLTDWWAPRPWTTEIIAHDLRPGGRSAMIMRGPNGEESGGDGVFLEVIPGKSVVFTDAFTEGWAPQGPFMVGFFRFEDEGGKTRYTAGARHWTAEALKQHEVMGFEQGWGTVAAQLEAVAKEMVGEPVGGA